MEIFQFSNILEFLGTFAFSISGIRLASAKRFDWFGAFVIGFATAVGGGTIRDVMLDQTPFWMVNPIYIISTGLALVVVIFYRKILIRLHYTIFTFDAIGLALFTVVGIEKTLACGFPFWVALIMGTITGCAGGIMRDVLITEIPLIFRKEIYAAASLFGGLFYFAFDRIGLPVEINKIITIIIIILTRILAVKFRIGLPVLKGSDEESTN